MAERHAPNLLSLAAGLAALAVAAVVLLEDLTDVDVDGRVVLAVLLLAAGVLGLTRVAVAVRRSRPLREGPQPQEQLPGAQGSVQMRE